MRRGSQRIEAVMHRGSKPIEAVSEARKKARLDLMHRASAPVMGGTRSVGHVNTTPSAAQQTDARAG